MPVAITVVIAVQPRDRPARTPPLASVCVVGRDHARRRPAREPPLEPRTGFVTRCRGETTCRVQGRTRLWAVGIVVGDSGDCPRRRCAPTRPLAIAVGEERCRAANGRADRARRHAWRACDPRGPCESNECHVPSCLARGAYDHLPVTGTPSRRMLPHIGTPAPGTSSRASQRTQPARDSRSCPGNQQDPRSARWIAAVRTTQLPAPLLRDVRDLDLVHERGAGRDHEPLLAGLLLRVEPAPAVAG